MKRRGFSDEQIIAILKEQEAGMATADVSFDNHIDAERIREAMARAEQDIATLRDGAPSDKRAIVLERVQRVDLGERSFAITLTLPGAPRLTGVFAQVRIGNDMKMLIQKGGTDQLVIRDEQRQISSSGTTARAMACSITWVQP